MRGAWQEAAQEDDRVQVARLSTDNPAPAISDAAEQALGGDATVVAEFLRTGQYRAGQSQYRIEIARLADTGGPVLGDAARAALNSNSLDNYRTFLATGQHTARVQDERVRAAQLLDSGGPEVRSAARIALEGPDELLHRFIDSGQHMAQRKDLLAATHVARVQALVAQAAGTAARAQQNAAEAHRVAAIARKAADEAKTYAAEASAASKTAETHAEEAARSAQEAEASAARAAASAATARQAADAAGKSAALASGSAADATVSSELAHASASTAWAHADKARKSAVAAGKDWAAADKAARDAFGVAIDKLKAEAEAERRKLRQDTPAERMRKCGLLGCPKENDPFHCDRKSPGDAFCTSLGMAKVVEPYARTMWELGVAIARLSQLKNCLDYDLDACMDLAQDAAINNKIRLLKGAYEGLRALNRIPCETCFPAGTKVLMADGSHRNIEDVEWGDLVRATDPVTGRTAARKVTRLIVTEHDKHFNTLTVGTRQGPAELTATYEHPFWSPSRGKWVEAADLEAGDTLLSDDGSRPEVRENAAFTQHARTYNLTVDDLHTYYVLAGETSVLVHNSDCPHIALGKSEADDNPFALVEFAEKRGADMFKHWSDDKQWYTHVREFLSEGNATRISFNLDGIPDPAAYAARGKNVDPANDFEGFTAWEIYQISQSPHAWDRITWYRNGKVVPNPFEKE
ncbi:polymorphic toxin-type HINT domain-containing protein [Streptomyces sp. NPDC007094]|uniref:polymorphic toxin-type HINT domain-containing protein n=1 Tax=Streptomyces sp. NPDC007094 TaxID=3155359 RepID=UPI0033E1DA1D